LFQPFPENRVKRLTMEIACPHWRRRVSSSFVDPRALLTYNFYAGYSPPDYHRVIPEISAKWWCGVRIAIRVSCAQWPRSSGHE
jgi:hypothetical protein